MPTDYAKYIEKNGEICIILFQSIIFFRRKMGSRMYQLVSLLCRWMYRENVIREDELEICSYGLQITLANLINFMIMLFIGIMYGTPWEMGIFYVVFISLRFFCGGYHANTYGKCFLMFGMTCFLAMTVSGLFIKMGQGIFLLFLAVAVVLGTYILKRAPIEHVNRPLSADEKYCFKRRGVQVHTFWFMMGMLFWYLQEKTFLAGIVSAFIMVLIYMFVKEGGESHEEKRT